MTTYIDLVDENADVTISTYPDSQINVIISDRLIQKGKHIIKSRLSSYQDLFKILATVDVLKNAGVSKIGLYCPCVLSSRSDRRFVKNQSFDLKIVADIINRCNFNQVIVADAHSDVLPALIDRCENRDAHTAWIKSVKFDWSDKILVSPDAGAYKKIFHLADKVKCAGIVTGNKVRLADGTPDIVIHGDVTGRHCVIVDDICDGGRTFETLGGKLKEMGAASVTLFVTHGIFSKGTILTNIDSIFTTNSYQSFDGMDGLENFTVSNIFSKWLSI